MTETSGQLSPTAETAPAAKKHSGMGIGSTVVGVLCLVSYVAIYAAIYYRWVLSDVTDEDVRNLGPNQLPLALLAVGFGFCFLLMLNVLGAGLAVGGFVQKNHKRLFAWIGLALNAVPLLAFAVRIIYVVATGEMQEAFKNIQT
ncbi:MAG: hypothetical protein ACREJB_02360 [Planctomycetaceae bacterium]